MKVVFGLGNPGLKYRYSRHNIGFLVLDYLAHFFLKEFESDTDLYKFTAIEIAGQDILLVKPMTYMNLSGRAVAAVMERFEILQEDIIVIVDDLQLPFGTLRIRPHGSDGGHNGLRSLIEFIGENRFTRLRFGIGEPTENIVDFVLNKFSANELKQLDELIEIAADAVKYWVSEDINELMNRFNRQHLTN